MKKMLARNRDRTADEYLVRHRAQGRRVVMLTQEQTDAYERVHAYVAAHSEMLRRMGDWNYVQHIAPDVIETPTWHMCEALLNMARTLLRYDAEDGQEGPALQYVIDHKRTPDSLVIQEAMDLLRVDEETLGRVA